MSHLSLGDADWVFWRWAAFRGAGFPVSLLEGLADPTIRSHARAVITAEAVERAARQEASAAIRRIVVPRGPERAALGKVLQQIWKGQVPSASGLPEDAARAIEAVRVARERADVVERVFATEYEAAVERTSRALSTLAQDPRIREAVTWQNRSVLRNMFDEVAASMAAKRRAKDRKNEAAVASYVQRYCAKNDTIGFFGPVGWARLDETVADVDITHDPSGSRSVYFEQFAIDTLAAKLSADDRLRPWMAARRLPFVRIEGGTVHSAVSGRHELDERAIALLGACDGIRTARELGVDEPTLLSALRDLHEKKLVAWCFEVPLGLHPERTLRALLERIDDASLRAEALAPLEELERARASVTESAGNVDALGKALDDLASTFTRLTGEAPSRRAGTMYAGRELVFEDCRRPETVNVGRLVLDALDAPLSLVLTSARWLCSEIGSALRLALRTIYGDLARRSKTGSVRFADLWFRAQRILYGTKDRPTDAAALELQRRWTRIIDAPEGARRVELTSAALRPRIQEEFDAPRPGWLMARVHSPDVMIAAAGVDAVRSGDFLLVLGEIHVAVNTITEHAVFPAQHPHPSDLVDAYVHDMPEPQILPVLSKEWAGVTARTNRAFETPSTWLLETGFDRAEGTREQVLALADLVVEDQEGVLVVRADDRRFDLVDVFATALAQIATFHPLPKQEHSPRVTIDRLVIARESWTVGPERFPFLDERDDARRFLAVQRWAGELGVPRFAFARTAVEPKPVFVDFASPVFVASFVKLVRAARENTAGDTAVTVSEMLPAPDEAWFEDRSGERYTSELRIVAVDKRR